MDNDIIVFGQDNAMLPFEGYRSTPNEIEKPFSSRPNMSTMLDVLWRPELLGSRVVSLIE
jgi:hypothetical protein